MSLGSRACSLHGAPFGPCSGAGRHQPGALAEGAHVFLVRATDAAGNTGADARRTFGVDTVPALTGLRLSRGTVKRSARKAKRRVTARFVLDQPAVVTLEVRRKGKRAIRRTANASAALEARLRVRR